MSLLSQIIQLLSEPPGNIVYHLVTLFALQAVFGLALNQARQDRRDSGARRTQVAAAAIFLGRLLILLLSLIWQENAVTSSAYLPPLTQAVDTITTIFLVWALIPYISRLPRLGVAILFAVLILVGVMTISFVQDWIPAAAAGAAYSETAQALIWIIVQMVLLAFGLVMVLFASETRLSLRPFVLGFLLLAQMAHYYNFPELIPSELQIAYWTRLGYLVALPLWAVQTYRQGQPFDLPGGRWRKAIGATLTPHETLPLATTMIQSLQTDVVLQSAIEVALQLTDARFVGIAFADPDDPDLLHLVSSLPQTDDESLRSWEIQVENWPAFRLAREQQQQVELRPNGLGARQLHLLYAELDLHGLGEMLVCPLQVEGRWVGLLLLSQAQDGDNWSNRARDVITPLADYVAHALNNSRQHAAVQQQIAQMPSISPSETIDSGRIIALEEEREQLRADLVTAQDRARLAEARAAEARKQAFDLAATLEEMERVSRDDRMVELEAEIAALRESLVDAEEAMAMAAAGESELSTDWVMLTITRYSSQLESAQARIETLETDLRRREEEQGNDLLTGLAQELRTPMTSIAGYTDLLLSESIGIVGAKQREFLQRIKANAERMGTLLDQIVQLTAATEEQEPQVQHLANIAEVIETAVHAVITQIREKHLRLDLNVDENLPSLPISQDALRQVLVHLLDNACRASSKNGRVTVTAQAKAVATPSQNGHPDLVNFVQLMVQDSGGGISIEDHAHVFDPQYQATHPLIPGLGDTGAGLAVARSLAVAHGGRMWVDGKSGYGTVFSVLFPLSAETEETTPSALTSMEHSS